MDCCIEKINELRAVENYPDLNLQVKHVIVVLSSSRSGSSLTRKMLETHPQIASLSGEMEPFMILSRNGFPYTSDSDSTTELSNIHYLLNNLFDDIGVVTQELVDLNTIKDRWRKRLLLQFPEVFLCNKNYVKLLESLDKAISLISEQNIKEERKINEIILHEVYNDEPWRINYYDGYNNRDFNQSFDEKFKIEEPPFVVPSLYKRSLKIEDMENKYLLFKTPQDAYRIGIHEKLFPNAEIKYIHLTRNYMRAINGLMDGWLSSRGFFAHNMENIGVTLNITGYSDCTTFGKKWWKFDLPPNWREFINTSLVNVCANQWLSAHKAILNAGLPNIRISFEEFLSQPQKTMNTITDYLGLEEILLPSTLPIVMATEMPGAQRWKKREEKLLSSLEQIKEIHDMMDILQCNVIHKTVLTSRKYRRLISPFLMGQRRDGLCRVQKITSNNWNIVDITDFRKTKIEDQVERLQTMGQIYLNLSEIIKTTVEKGFIPVSIAGDCVSTIGVLAGLQKANKQPDRIIWLDAHGDFHTWETSQTKYIGGMPLAMLVGRGEQTVVDAVGLIPYPEDFIILSDARDLDPGEKEAVMQSKMTKCNVQEIKKYIQPCDNVYLHFDTDVVSAEQEMPALKYHVNFGPTYSEMRELFQSLCNLNIIAISLSAWHEEKDLDNKTATACLKLLKSLGVNIDLI